jgi:raffinose/stachyose/melibiose transport system permease protein
VISLPFRKKEAGAKEVLMRRKGIAPWLVLSGMLFAVALWLFPMYIAIINAFKPEKEYVQGGVLTLPKHLDFTKIVKFWNDVDFNQKLYNSIKISLAVSIIAVVLSFFTAYAIGIGRIKGRMSILGFFMVAFTLPQEALVYPMYKMSKQLNLYDTHLGLIIIFGVMNTGFGTYMLSSVLSTFPEEILESARIDGASPFKIMRSIVLPLVRPTLFVLAVMFFIYTWNEFLIPLVLLASNENQTVTLAMAVTTGQYTSDPTARAAAALVGIAPSVIFFLIFQRTLMRGITVGSVK